MIKVSGYIILCGNGNYSIITAKNAKIGSGAIFYLKIASLRLTTANEKDEAMQYIVLAQVF